MALSLARRQLECRTACFRANLAPDGQQAKGWLVGEAGLHKRLTCDGSEDEPAAALCRSDRASGSLGRLTA